MSINIRIGTEKDFGEIHALNVEFSHFIKTPEKFRMSVEQMKLEQQHFRILVAETDD